MTQEIRIGTRESELALWQADLVRDMLEDRGIRAVLVPVKSEGDMDLQTPLYEMGIQGVFTRSLDAALVNNHIDIAVHSMKDVPTVLPRGIVQAAVLKRGNYRDLFVINENHQRINADKKSPDHFDIKHVQEEASPMHDLVDSVATIATGSIRRKAQWLHRYPKHQVVNLRGNVNRRMEKIAASDWDGAVMAAAGLERINLRPKSAMELNWMLPAPAQGAIMVVCRDNNPELLKALARFNHEETETEVSIEREFLRALLGGCSTPISALAVADKKDIYFKGNILSLDGKVKVEVEKHVSRNNTTGFGMMMAGELLKNGGKEISDAIKNG